jgi:hypothetical protein
MKLFRFVFMLAFVVSPAFAQRPPSDTKLLHDVSAVLETEKAFRGLLIVPKVYHGTVTLTGTVSSEGDKVLASMEVGNVEGVRTVLNNLTVGKVPAHQDPALTNSEGAQVQALTSIPRQAAAAAIQEKSVTIPAGALLQIRLGDSISTKTAKVDDHFRGTLATPVYAGGFIAVPQGTAVVGRVSAAKQPGHFVAPAELSLELTAISMPSPAGEGQELGIITEQLSSNGNGRGANTVAKTGGGAAAGAVIGALAGGGEGAAIGAASGGGLGLGSNAITRGGQIELKPESLLRFKTAAPITATVYSKGGKQIELPAVSPALQQRSDAK